MKPASERYQHFTATGYADLGHLIAGRRQAALATAGPGGPHAAMVAYTPSEGGRSFLVHLSDLSPHKAQLRSEPRCSLLIMEADHGRGEVMLRRRAAVECAAYIIDAADPGYPRARTRYLDAFPSHGRMFDLGDFDLVRLEATGGVYIAGFGQAYRLTPAAMTRALATVPGGGEGPVPS